MNWKTGLTLWVIYVLISLGVFGAIVWAVIHFVSKYW
jgi:hypothetical protein